RVSEKQAAAVRRRPSAAPREHGADGAAPSTDSLDAPTGSAGLRRDRVVDVAIADAILAEAGSVAVAGRRTVRRAAALRTEKRIRVIGFQIDDHATRLAAAVLRRHYGRVISLHPHAAPASKTLLVSARPHLG